MRTIYFMVPDKKTTQKIVAEIRAQDIGEQNIHVLAKRGTSLKNLPEASFMQKTDFIPAIERGLILGGMVGLVAGVFTQLFSDITVSPILFMGLFIAGAGIGFLAGGLIGLSAGNSRLKQFETAIGKGEFLVLLDIPKEQIDKISKAITQHHPSVDFKGTEPVMPPSY